MKIAIIKKQPAQKGFLKYAGGTFLIMRTGLTPFMTKATDA